jgi:hypothetical protein
VTLREPLPEEKYVVVDPTTTFTTQGRALLHASHSKSPHRASFKGCSIERLLRNSSILTRKMSFKGCGIPFPRFHTKQVPSLYRLVIQ